MYLVRQAEPDVKYPVTQRDMMKEAARLRAIDGKTVSLHVEIGPVESITGTRPNSIIPDEIETPKRGRKKADNSLITPVDAESHSEPMSGHAESSGARGDDDAQLRTEADKPEAPAGA